MVKIVVDVYKRQVYGSRMLAGRYLAMDSAVEADLVVGVPESGNAAALGYSLESGIPFGTAFVKNGYVGRTFIKPKQSNRESSVRIKLNVLSEAVKGKRVIMIDDSIVRGTTCDRIVGMLKEAGATEVDVYKRQGRCRPYLLCGIWPVSVLFVLLFGMPELSASLRGFCGGTLYVAFCLVYAVMNVPFSTLMSLMTADAGERVQFNKYKCLGSNIGGVFVTGTTMLFVTHLAGNQRQGFLRTAMLFAVLFTVFMLICFFNTKERIRPDGPENNPDIRKAMSSLKQNKPWLLYCAIQFCQLTFMMIRHEATRCV